MDESIAFGLAVIFVLGIGAQWLAWRTRIPAILMLLVFGLIAGPVTGLLDPEKVLGGPLIQPIVSIAVGLILFEGGLSLRLHEIRDLGRVLFSLVTVGVVVSWGCIALAARLILGVSPGLALMLGAMLVVTGPTVIGPMLRHVRPSGPAASILKWEGIVIDPIGVVLGLMVLDCLLATNAGEATLAAVRGIVATVLVGTVGGAAAAWLTHVFLKRYWVPDHLQNPCMLALVVGVFAASNAVQPESGLLTVTVMGAFLANQKSVAMRHIVEFKENLRVLLISSIFIVLAAKVELSTLREHLGLSLLFILALVLVARPLSVAVATFGSGLGWRDRLFLMWMAPRGVVAAAVSSVFALELTEAGYEGAEIFIPVTFSVIVGTVTLYGLTASWVARRLGVAGPTPQGFLLLGAHRWSRALARTLGDQGFRVVILDSNRARVTAARLEGLDAQWGDAMAETTLDDLDLSGIGRFLAITPNDQVNRLAAQHMNEVFGRAHVYRLASGEKDGDDAAPVAQDTRGRLLFATDLGFEEITALIAGGASFKATKLSEEFDFESFRRHAGDDARVLFVISKDDLRVASADAELQPQAGDVVVSLA